MRVAAGFGAQDRDADVGGGVPVGVEAFAGRVEEREPGDVRWPAGVGVHVVVEGAGERVRGEDVHAAVAHERRAGGDGVERPLQARPGRRLERRTLRSAPHGGCAVGGAGEVGEVFSFGVVELQGAGDGVEYLVGRAVDGAAFDLGVVLDAEPGERGDFAAPQPGHPPVVTGGQPTWSGVTLARRDTRKSRTSLGAATNLRVGASRRWWGALPVHLSTWPPTNVGSLV